VLDHFSRAAFRLYLCLRDDVSDDDVCSQDGLVSPTDAALRDLSATCLKEFVEWSIKQSTPQVVQPHADLNGLMPLR